MNKILVILVCIALPLVGVCQTNIPAPHGANTLAQAKQLGEARAKADIAKGTMQILYYGPPWSMGKPLVDDETRLPVKIVSGCCVMPDFVAETDAYNAVMRQAAKERMRRESANKPPEDSARKLADPNRNVGR